MAEKMLDQKVVWREDCGITPEIDYLIRYKKFEIFWIKGVKYFSVLTPRGIKSFPINTQILFFNIEKDDNGEIVSLKYRVKPVVYWKGECGCEEPEISYLLKHGLIIDPDDFESMYRYKDKQGSWHYYPNGAVFKFFDINMDKDGTILDLKFHVLVKDKKTVTLTDNNPKELDFLIRKNRLIIDCDNDTATYKLETNSGWKTYPHNSRAQFWNYEYDQNGDIISANFKIQQLKWI